MTLRCDRHVPALDGIRGIAILGVLGTHGSFVHGGHLGVVVFFTLSGYLITSLLLAEWTRHGRISLPAFYRRRAARLLPAVVAVCAATVLLGASVLPRERVAHLVGWPLLPTAGYVSNIVYAADGHGQALGWFDWSWSLAIEEQFYLVWPALLIVALRWRKLRALAVVAAAGVVLAEVQRLSWVSSGHLLRLYMGTDTRMDALLVGCLLAFALHRWQVSARVAALTGWLSAGVLLVGYEIATQDLHATYTVWLLLVPLATAGLIVAGSRDGRVGRGLSWAPLTELGRASYSLYLWNLLPAYVVGALTGKPVTGFWALGCVCVSIPVGLASYRWVERPARAWLRGAPARPVVAPVAALTAAR